MLKIENTEVVGWEAAIRGMRNPKNSWEKSDSITCTEKMAMTNEEIESECGKCPKHDNCDIYDSDPHFIAGPNDHALMMQLRNAGTDHRKFMRMIVVYLDITAPLYWWKEFKTYRAGKKFGDDEPDIIDIIDEGYLEYDIEMNSCSTMHKIADKEFTLEDFSHEHLIGIDIMPSDAIISGKYPYVDVTPYQNKAIIYSPLGVLSLTIDMLNDCRLKYLTALKTAPETGLSAKDIWWQMIQLLPSSYNQRRTVMLNYEVLANMYKSRRHHKLDEWHTFCDWVESLPYSELITGEDEAKASAEIDGKE